MPPTTTASPGNIVVPMSTILQALEGVLTPAERDALLGAVVGVTGNQVRPGDLISAQLMNQLLGTVSDLSLRVAQLEGGTTAQAPVITSIQPQVVRMGEQLTVDGSGLAPATLSSITIDGSPVALNDLKPGSGATRLIFDAPPIIGVPEAGRTAVLKISGAAPPAAVGTFFLLPGVETVLSADFTITQIARTPAGAFVANTTYDITYEIAAITTMDATYTLAPVMTGTGGTGWTAAIKNGVTQIAIPKSQPTASKQTVVVSLHTGTTGARQVGLAISAPGTDAADGGSVPQAVTIGANPAPPSTDIVFSLPPTITGSVQKFANGNIYVRTDAAAPTNQKAVISTLNTLLKVPGVYDIGPPTINGSGWTVTINNSPATLTTTGEPNKTLPLRFTVTAAVSAADAVLNIPVTGRSGGPASTLSVGLRLRANPSSPNPV